MLQYLKFLTPILFSVNAGAASMDIADCPSTADLRLKAVLGAVAFPPDYLQVGMIDRIERLDFKNITPGTYEQEYLGTYRLIYKNQTYALFREQEIRVQFASPFICDNLRVACLDVISSTPARGVDPAVISKTGPLQCTVR